MSPTNRTPGSSLAGLVRVYVYLQQNVLRYCPLQESDPRAIRAPEETEDIQSTVRVGQNEGAAVPVITSRRVNVIHLSLIRQPHRTAEEVTGNRHINLIITVKKRRHHPCRHGRCFTASHTKLCRDGTR